MFLNTLPEQFAVNKQRLMNAEGKLTNELSYQINKKDKSILDYHAAKLASANSIMFNHFSAESENLSVCTAASHTASTVSTHPRPHNHTPVNEKDSWPRESEKIYTKPPNSLLASAYTTISPQETILHRAYIHILH